MIEKQVKNIGKVTLVDFMGSDKRVLEAARTSTGASATKGPEKDKALIDYLMKNRHHTPFEKIVFEFHVECPIFVARQWFRHRMGSFNEASARYKEFEWSPYKPDRLRLQSTNNAQGSSNQSLSDKESEKIFGMIDSCYEVANQTYEYMLSRGVAKELARVVMPVSQKTEFFWTVNFRSLMNFIELRSHSHAQEEIRMLSNSILNMISSIPELEMSIEAFRDNSNVGKS